MESWQIFLIIAIFVLGVFAGSAYYTYSELNKIYISDFSLKDVEVGLSGAVIKGELLINNPSIFAVYLEGVDYFIYLEEVEVSRGSIIGGELAAKEISKFDFEQEITWNGLGGPVLEILSGGDKKVMIKGKAYVNIFGIYVVERSATWSTYLSKLIGG